MVCVFTAMSSILAGDLEECEFVTTIASDAIKNVLGLSLRARKRLIGADIDRGELFEELQLRVFRGNIELSVYHLIKDGLFNSTSHHCVRAYSKNFLKIGGFVDSIAVITCLAG